MRVKPNNILGVATNDLPHIATRECQFYGQWKTIIERCYNPNKENYPWYGGIGCFVSEEWKLRSNFNNWMISSNYRKGLQVDKDLLFSGNKEYSPETCCLLPPYLNAFFNLNMGKSSPYPVGVIRRIPTVDMVNDYTNPYVARIRVEGRSVTLGYYPNPEEAHEVWLSAKIEALSSLVGKYKEDPSFNNQVFDALKERGFYLEDHLHKGQQLLNF